MMKPGQARSVMLAKGQKDPRVGIFPQHNSQGAFRDGLEPVEAITFEEYDKYFDNCEFEKAGWQKTKAVLTKKKIREVAHQFANLSSGAFRQMMYMVDKDKRDFVVYTKHDQSKRETSVAYTNTKTGLTHFVQVITRDTEGNIRRLVHCMYDKGMPFVINESIIDEEARLRQIAHVGKKGDSKVKNALERFDDGTVTWTVTNDEGSGTAALKPNGEIIILGDGDMDYAKMLAARNLGAEGLTKRGTWDGCFSLQACLANDHPMQKEYKDAVRRQINQIVDGTSLPGLKPIFDVHVN